MKYTKKRKKTKEKDKDKHVIVTRTLLVKPNQLTKNAKIVDKLNSTVKECHEVIQDSYDFIKLYLLDQFETVMEGSKEISVREKLHSFSTWMESDGPWRKLFFSQVASLMCSADTKGQRGRKPNDENKDDAKKLRESLKKFRVQGLFNKSLDKQNLSFILAYATTGIKTAYENNISMHFDKYVKRYIRSIAKFEILSHFQVEKLQDVPKYFVLQPKLIMNKIVRATFSGKLRECTPPDDKFSEIFRIIKDAVILELEIALPHGITENIFDNANLSLSLAHMIYMNRNMETKYKVKLLRPFPLRNSNIPCNIMLDTHSIIDILVSEDVVPFSEVKSSLELLMGLTITNLKNKGSLYNNLKKILGLKKEQKTPISDASFKTLIWKSIFECMGKKWLSKRFAKVKSKGKPLVFNNMITTDGYKVDLHFTDEQSFEAKRFTTGSILCGAKREDTTFDFMYVQELSSKEKKDLEPTILFCDPGKGNIITITNGNEVPKEERRTMTYSTFQRQKESSMLFNLKQSALLLALTKDEDGVNGKTIKEHVESLAESNSKSCVSSTFIDYLKRRDAFKAKTLSFYQLSSHRRRRLRARLGRQSSEELAKNRIIETFNLNVDSAKQVTDTVIVWGNWGLKSNLKNQAPSPGIGYRRSVSRWIPTITVDERNTSSHCPTCEGCVEVANIRCNRWVKKEKANKVDIHSVHHLLRCKNENCKSKWWNRDVLATFNIQKQFNQYKITGKPYNFGGQIIQELSV